MQAYSDFVDCRGQLFINFVDSKLFKLWLLCQYWGPGGAQNWKIRYIGKCFKIFYSRTTFQ